MARLDPAVLRAVAAVAPPADCPSLGQLALLADRGTMQVWGGPGVVLDVAKDADGRRRLQAETAGRAWAVGIDVRVPEVLAAAPDGAWVLSRRGSPLALLTPSLAVEAVELAERVEHGPQRPAADATSWRAPRRTLPARLARLVREQVPLGAFRAARAAAADLPDDAMAHGDLHTGNLLEDASGLVVVDWEYLAPAPAGTDVMRLWSTAELPEERAAVLELVLAHADKARRERLGVLGRWLALRSLAEAASGSPSTTRTASLSVARAVMAELDQLPR